MSKWNIFVDIHSIHTYISEIRVGDVGNSLAVLWLRLCTLIAEALSSIPGQGTKILQTMQCGQKYIYIIIKKNQYPTFFELYIIPVTALLSKDYFIYILE